MLDNNRQTMVRISSAEDELDLGDKDCSNSSTGSCSPLTPKFSQSKFKDSNDVSIDKRARIYSPKCEKPVPTSLSSNTNFINSPISSNMSPIFNPLNLLQQQPMLHAQFYSALQMQQQSRSLSENMSSIAPLLLNSVSSLPMTHQNQSEASTQRTDTCSQPMASSDKQLLELMHAHFARYYPLSFAMPSSSKLLQNLDTNKEQGKRSYEEKCEQYRL